MRNLLDTPWKFWNGIGRWWTYPWVRLLFAVNAISWGSSWRFYGIPIIQKHRHSTMRFGNGLQLRSSVRSNPLGPYRPVVIVTWTASALLEVGENFGMTGGTICAAERISIGNNVAVGANTSIMDTDFHPLDPEQRRLEPERACTAPVVIEDDVFIGMNCLILKGVTLGRGSVVGAGSVVPRDVAAHTIVCGNPAKVVRTNAVSSRSV